MSLQVVWVKSTQLGVAKAEKASGGTILVFRYYPSGNSGKYAENVKPPVRLGTTKGAATKETTIGTAVCYAVSIKHMLAVGIMSIFLQALI